MTPTAAQAVDLAATVRARVPALRHRAAAAAGPDVVAAYQRDGAVCLRGLLTPDEVATLARGIDANLARPSPQAIVASRPDDPGRFVEDFCTWSTNTDYRAVIGQTPLAEVGALLMGSRRVRLYHDHMLTKEPGTRQRTPWHQDQPYYNVDGRQNVSFWIPVDPVRRHSTLEFIAGSHRGPWLMPRTFLGREARWFPEGSLAELPDIDGRPDDFPRLGWALAPGDVVCFHMLALHAAAGVDADRRRRVFSLRLLGDDMVHAPRRWTTSPPFPGLDQRLPAGAPMDDPLFPLLIDDAPGDPAAPTAPEAA